MVDLEIELEKRNYFDYYLFDFFTNIKEYIGAFIVFFICFIPMVYFIVIGGIVFAYLLMLPVLGIVIGIIIRILSLNNKTNMHIKNGLNKCRLIFDEDKFIEENRVEKLEYNSSAILKVAENKKYLFLFKYHRVAWILPKNQLNENQYNEILEFLNRNDISIKNYS